MPNNRIYKTWNRIKQRCYNKNAPNYKNYGARELNLSYNTISTRHYIGWSDEECLFGRDNNDN